MPAILKVVIKSIGFVLALAIITAAALVCISRLVTPALDEHKVYFEQAVSHLLQTPVTINAVQASWYQYQPEINLAGVTVLDPGQKNPVLQIKDLNVFISLPQSLWQRKLVVKGVMVSGSTINVHKDEKGNYAIQGFPQLENATPYENETELAKVLTWLTQEQRLILHNINLHYTGVNQESRSLTLHDLSLGNSGDDHSLVGTATLHQKLATNVSLALEWEGKNLDLNQITGKAYIYMSGLDVAQWLKGWDWQGWQIKQGISTSKLWLTWDKGKLQNAQINLQAYGLKLFSTHNRTMHTINRVSGNFGWKQEANADIFAGEDVLIDLPQHFWPATSFYVKFATKPDGEKQAQQIKVGYLNLSDVTPFVLASGVLDSEQSQWLIRSKLKGNVQQASLDWYGKQGQIQLASKYVSFNADNVFANPILFNSLNGNMQITHEVNQWIFNTQDVSLSNSDMQMKVKGNARATSFKDIQVDLASDFNLLHAENVTHYLPLKFFTPKLNAWLNTAFVSGSVPLAHAEVRGKLSDFPFDNNTGKFFISGDVKDINLHYASGWPDLNEINGKLIFAGRTVTVDAKSAKILDVPIGMTYAEIPYLSHKVPTLLNVSSDPIQMDFKQAINFVENSPLQAKIGKIFKSLTLEGPMQLKLGLMFPLDDMSKSQVRGVINMADDQMKLPAWNLAMDKVKGSLNFTEDSVSANGLQAELFAKPFHFNLLTRKQSNTSWVEANFATNLNMLDLENWLKVPVTKVAKGEADVNGKIIISFTDPLQLSLKSDLAGIALDLPAGYGKSAIDKKDFNLDLVASDKNEPLKLLLNYDKSASVAVLVNALDKGYQLKAADLHINAGSAAWPEENGLYVTANLQNLDASKIQEFLTHSEQAQFDNVANMPLLGVEVKTDNFTMGRFNLKNLHLQAVPEKENWLVDVDAQDAKGQLQIPKKLNSDAKIIANFNRLTIPALNAGSPLPSINIKSLPVIYFNANSFTYDDKRLGMLSFKTQHTPMGLAINNFQINSPRVSLRASGKWLQEGNKSKTYFDGVAVSNHVDDLLTSLGYDARNFIVNQGQLNFNLHWDNAPYAFELPNIQAKLALNVGKGRIADIGQESQAKMDLGRMLSIFSLQTIPRRLMFDFSDVFQKGYSFDNLRGNLILKNGNLYTNNLKFNGPVAMVGINGRIGLLQKDYDFTLLVSPYVTSSIPVAALLLSQPLIGLAAFAVNSVIGPTLLSKVTTYYYAVSGPWAHPLWKSVSVYQQARR